MRPYAFCFLGLTSAIFCIGIPAGAQTQETTNPPLAPPGPAASPTAVEPPPAAAKLSREIIKKAQQVGFRAQLSKGTIMFCKNDAAIGTRIISTRCLTENEFDIYLLQLKYAQDNIQRSACGNNCNGSKGQTP